MVTVMPSGRRNVASRVGLMHGISPPEIVAEAAFLMFDHVLHLKFKEGEMIRPVGELC